MSENVVVPNKPLEYIPYKKYGEPDRRAVIVAVEFDISNLDENDLNVLGNLSEAVDRINPIFQDQFEPATPHIRGVVRGLINDGEDSKLLRDYLTMLDIQNSPFDLITRKNHLLQLDSDNLRGLITKIGKHYRELYPEMTHDGITGITKFFFDPKILSDKANLYPHDIRDEELEALDGMTIPNSSVLRTGDGLKVVLNEEKYRETLKPIIEYIERAKEASRNPNFRKYLEAKIEELKTGSGDARRESDLKWLKNDSDIDFILSTALEVYLDSWKSIRRSASGAVMVVDRSAEDFLRALVEQMPYMEREAPWKLKKEEIDPSKLPTLKFVNVLNWSGEYVSAPQTTVAQSLPNDKHVIDNYGSVNIIYRNIFKAIHGVTGNKVLLEFLPREIADMGEDMFFDATQLHFMLHELGHTTGRMEDQFKGREPSEILGDEYSGLEECRADLFGLYTLPRLVREGIITEDQMNACYHDMVATFMFKLKFDPRQAHIKASNIIYHYLRGKNAIGAKDEEGKTRFFADVDRIHEVAYEMLGIIGNVKSAGNREKAREFRERYCYTDELKEEVEERTKHLPLGRGLIFPQLKREGKDYTRKLIYPSSFSEQPRFSYTL